MARIVVIRPVLFVAGDAVRKTGVIETGIHPAVGIVTVGALPRVMTSRCISGMARDTIRITIMIKAGIRPAAGIVTVRALSGVMA